MKKIIISVVASFVMVSGHQAFAQNIVKQRLITESALSTIENMISTISIRDEESYSEFVSLFVNDKVPVYNDLLGIDGSSILPVNEYANLQMKKTNNPQINIANIIKERIWEENGKWKVTLSYDKSQSYTNPCGVYFSSMDFYRSVFRETATMVYNEQDKTCLIEKIEGTVDSNKIFPKDFYVFKRTSELDDRLMFIGKDNVPSKMSFNNYDQAMLDGNVDTNSFKFGNSDVTLKPNVQSDCRTVTMDYIVRHWRVKAHADIPFGYYNIASSDKNIETKSNGMEFGVDFGYGIVSKENFRLSLYLGLGMANSNIDIALNSTDYSYTTNEDIDGDSYIRHYNNVTGTEAISVTNFQVPIYLDGEISIIPYLSVYLQAGIINGLNISNSISNTNIHADNVYGIYPQYNNMVLDYRWGFNNFRRDVTWSNCNVSNVKFNSYTLDAIGGAGLRVHPVRELPLYVDLGLAYTYGINDVFTNSDPKHNYVEYTQSGASGTDNVYGLKNSITSIKKQHLKFSIGVMYKF